MWQIKKLWSPFLLLLFSMAVLSLPVTSVHVSTSPMNCSWFADGELLGGMPYLSTWSCSITIFWFSPPLDSCLIPLLTARYCKVRETLTFLQSSSLLRSWWWRRGRRQVGWLFDCCKSNNENEIQQLIPRRSMLDTSCSQPVLPSWEN